MRLMEWKSFSISEDFIVQTDVCLIDEYIVND